MSCYTGIAAGRSHSLALLKSGSITGWGAGATNTQLNDDYGQIRIPIEISDNAVGISAGLYHSLALLKDGTVTGWGYNGYGQTTIPVGIGNNAVGISAGGYHSLALLKDGRVTGWGRSDYGQIPIPVGIGNNATGISAGFIHSLALLKDGRVIGWGYNGYGQTTIPVGIGNNATGISAGSSHSLALLKDGRVTGWGAGSTSQVNGGPNGVEYGQIIIPPGIGNNAVAISAGEFHSTALLKDGRVTGWGLNANGVTNIPVGIGNNATGIVAGYYHTLALLKDGRITGWGRDTNSYGVPVGLLNIPTCPKINQTITFPSIPTKSFGDPVFYLDASSDSNLPITYSSSNPSIASITEISGVKINNLGSVTITASQPGNSNYEAAVPVSRSFNVNCDYIRKISAGSFSSIALLKDGRVTGWGSNIYGQLNILVGIGNNATGISAGQSHALVLLKDGRVTGWGNNTYGQLNIPAGIGNNATGISAGYYHSLALLKDGRVTGWGADNWAGNIINYGQINIPAGIGTNATEISAGQSHSLALLKDGRVTGWGSNSNGQLNIPAGIGNNATGISAGSYHSVALLKDGRVTGWGNDSATIFPTEIGNNATAISAGYFYSLALLKDGRVTGWGNDSYVKTNLLAGIGNNATGISAGYHHAFVLLKDGTATGLAWSNFGVSAINIPLDINCSFTKFTPTLTFPSIPTKTFGDASFNLGVTSTNSTTPITYTSSNANVATVSSNGTVSIIGAGTTTITASQAGDSNYNAATPASQTLTVNKINQTISFPSIPTKTFGDASFNLGVTSTNSTTPITYTSSNANVATVSSNGTVSIIGAGTTTITASQAGDSNYNAATPVSQTLAVNKADQTITFPSIPTKTFGDALFSLTAAASSNLAVSYTSSNTSVATVAGNIVTIVGVGTTTITASQIGNNNYNAAVSVSQDLIIGKGNQTIIFNSIPEKIIGDPPFVPSASSSANLPISFTSNNNVITIQNNTAIINSAGQVTITASQAGNDNYNPASVSQTIYVKNRTTINFPFIPNKFTNDVPFNLNVSSNNPNQIFYTSSNTSIATVETNGTVTILGAGTINITAYQNSNQEYSAESVTRVLQIEILDINKVIEIIQPTPYLNYSSKIYKQNFGNEFYNIQLPRALEPHILLLDLNLYGFDEDKLEDCDIEMNAMILKTGFFKDVIKNPSILNLEIKDLKYPTGIINNMSDYLKEKSILKDVKVNNFINYDTSYYNNATIYSDTKYRFIKNKFFIQKPIASRTKNIPLPIFFKYKSPTNNAFYDLGEYNFSIYQGENQNKKFIKNINYITGEEFGFLSYLTPGEYTAILSGKEEDFLISENSPYRKNQNISTTSLSIDLFTGEKFEEVYIESADEIWASYYLDYAELVSGSGFNTLSNQLPIAFNIDFERNFSGIVGIPSLQYKEYTGDFFNFCTSTQETIESDPICTKSLEFLCAVAATYEKSGIFEIDVPRKNFPKSKYGIEGISSLGMGSTLTPYVIDLIEGAVSGNNGSLITYLEDPEDQNYYTIAIDSALKDLCCRCKIAKEWSDPTKEVQTQIYSGVNISESGDAIYKNVFFFDTMSPKALDLKYNSTYYSGQIVFKDFYEGDKLSFKQYPFDFDLVYKSLYSVSPSLTRKEYTIDFIYSDTITGYNYFSGKQDLINKINNNLASKSYYSWLPFKYNPKIEFDYGPLLSSFDMGVNSKNEEVIGLVGLKEGKLGSYSMRLNLESRLQIYNYLAPKIIKLQVSEDGENWTDIVSSENRQPINTYLKYPTATVSRPTTETNIRYDELPNTKYKYEITVPISSEITSQNIGTDVEDLSGLAISIFNKFPLVSGNKNSTSGINSNVKKQVVCIPDPTGSGITCGTGFIDFDLTSTSKDGGFNCREPSEEEPCPLVWPGIIKSGSLIEESLVTEYDEDAKNSPYFGYSGNCCTGEYDIIMRPTGWCCSGTYISGINERGCKPPEKEPDGETKDQEFITISQEMNAFRLGFYDYNS